MATENFERCLALTLRYEGGYSDHPLDPGGATNMGITRATLAGVRGRPVAKSEVMALTRAEAAGIYRRLFWGRIAGDALPPGVDAALFDFAVNSGCGRAVRALRRIVGAGDGDTVDAATLTRLDACDPRAAITGLCRDRRVFLQRLRFFSAFGKGWSARVAAVEAAALAMSDGHQVPSQLKGNVHG